MLQVGVNSSDHTLRLRIADELVVPDKLLSLLQPGVDLRHHSPVGFGRLEHVVVKAVDLDVHVPVAQARERLDQVHRGRRIDGREAGVLVEGQKTHTQLHVDKAAAAELKGWSRCLIERRARFPKAPVCAQLARMLVGDRLERLGADLLFAFDQEAQSDRDFPQLL